LLVRGRRGQVFVRKAGRQEREKEKGKGRVRKGKGGERSGEEGIGWKRQAVTVKPEEA
jgi:hypothetical protein